MEEYTGDKRTKEYKAWKKRFKDKRTKEYKAWKNRFKEQQEKKADGLGDIVENITEATGIKALVEKFTPEGKDCGCNKRKEALNHIFPLEKPECLEENEFEFLSKFFSRRRISVNYRDKEQLYVIYNRVFNKNESSGSCTRCINRIIKRLKAIINEYK